MNIKSCELKEKNEYQIIVEVNPEEFETAVGKAFVKNRKSIMVPGFRKGKAPRKIIEGMYGATVFHPDAVELLLPDVLEFTDNETDLKTVGQPQITDVDIKEDKSGVHVTIMTAIYPEVKLGAYKGLTAVKPSTEIPDSAVDAEVASAQLRSARIEKADRPAVEGDITVIDFDGYVDGKQFEGGKSEGYELELGSKAFIPGFEDKVVGMSPGEQRDIELIFPEEYTPELAGKSVVFKVTLHEIKEKQLPELDDEFAKDVSEFDTLKEYKADIKARLTSAKEAEANTAFENALLEKVIEHMEVEVPNAMIEEQMDMAMNSFAMQIQSYGMDPAQYLQMMNITPEAFRENTRLSSEKGVKISLALEKIAELEAIEVSTEDIEKEYAQAAERFEMELDKIKKSVPEDKVVSDIKSRLAAKIVTESGVATAPTVEEEKSEKTVAKKATVKKVADKKPKATDGAKEKKATPKKAATKKADATASTTKKANADESTTKKAPAKKATVKKAATKKSTDSE
ncbi:MAG: trigger factor [Oscillospiraceae bacterium]|nr:trigger factor [Oscillospiraceae bacterium]